MEQNYEKKVKDIKEVTLKTITKKMICEYTSKLITQNVITKEEIEKQRKEWNRIKLNEKQTEKLNFYLDITCWNTRRKSIGII